MAKRIYQKNNNRAGKICISLILIAFMAVMSVQIVNLYQKNQECIEEQAELDAQIADEKARQVELEQYEKEINSRSSVESTARSKLGLVYEDEIIFKEEK